MKKVLLIILVLSMLINCLGFTAGAEGKDINLTFDDNSNWVPWNTTNSADISDTWVSAGGLGAKKMTVAKGAVKDSSKSYFTYNFTNDFVRDENTQIITFETRVKMTSCYHSFRLIGNGSDGGKWFFQLAFNADGSITDGNTGAILGAFSSDDSVNPDFTSGWHTFWFEVNEGQKLVRLYMDNKKQFFDLNFKDQWNGAPVSFTAVSWFLSTRTNVDNTIYQDYFKLYSGEAKGFPETTFDLNMDFTDTVTDKNGKASWSGNLPSLSNRFGAAKVEALSTAADGISVLNIAALNREEPFTAEIRVKSPSARSKSITMRMNDKTVNGGKAVTVTAQAESTTEHSVWVDETNGNKVLGKLKTDIAPANPDFEMGWNTIYMCVDPIIGKYTVYLDSLENSSGGTFATSVGNFPSDITFTVGKLQTADIVSEMYIDYIKIYSYESTEIPQSIKPAQNKIITDFDSLNIGDNVRRGLLGSMTQDNSFTALVAPDPVNSGNKCLEFKNNMASNGYAYIVAPFKNVVFSFKIFVPQNTLSNQVQFRDTTGAVISNAFTADATCKIENNNISTPFIKGQWNTVKWIVDGTTGTCYVNDNAPISVSGTYDVRNIRFGIFPQRSLFIDDICIYELDGTPIITADKIGGTVGYGEKIHLFSDKANTQIFYTVDGTEPTINSTQYTDSGIEILKNGTTIKTFGFAEGKQGWLYSFGKYTFEFVDDILFADAQFKKNGSKLNDADGLAENDIVSADFTIVSNDTDLRPLTLILGIYDGDVLYEAKSECISVIAGSTLTKSISLTVPKNSVLKNWNVKAFVWENTLNGRTLGFRRKLEKQ